MQPRSDPSYESLTNLYGGWERCDARSGGLQEWALLEICSEKFSSCTASIKPIDQRPFNLALLPTVGTPVAAVVPTAEPARQRLTHEEAVAIYLARLRHKSCKSAARLAAEFGITAKAVRDVWTGKTWAAQTRSMWKLQSAKDFILPSTSRTFDVAAARVNALSRDAPKKPALKHDSTRNVKP